MHPTPQSAVNTLPASVTLLFLPIVAVQGFIAGMESGLWGHGMTRLHVLQTLFFAPDYAQELIGRRIWAFDMLYRFVSYPFVNASFLQAVFGSVFLLALGKFVGEVLGDTAVFAVFFGSAIAGAVAYMGFTQDSYPLFGAFAPSYGLIGAFSFVLFASSGDARAQPFAAFQLLGILMAINLGFSLIGGGPKTWVADLAAAAAGFLIVAALRPGGIAYVIAKLRRPW